jgi:hypothetical protein
MRLRINKELNSKPDTALHKNYFKPAVGLYAQREVEGRRAFAASRSNAGLGDKLLSIEVSL